LLILVSSRFEKDFNVKRHEELEFLGGRTTLQCITDRRGMQTSTSSLCLLYKADIVRCKRRVKHIGQTISYYPNTVKTFRIIQVSGDIEQNPGPNEKCTDENRKCWIVNSNLQANYLSVFYANARSIVNKIDKLRLEIESGQIDIVVLTETHLDNNVLDSEFFSQDFVVFRRDRKHLGRHGGGVLISLKKGLQAIQREDVDCMSELLFVDIMLHSKKKLSLGVFYRPPDEDSKSLEELNRMLGEKISSDVILLGEFNITGINWINLSSQRNSVLQNLLMYIVPDHFLNQLIDQPTRDLNILDLILTTSIDYVRDVQVGEPFSDHNLITFKICRRPYENRQSRKQCYSFEEGRLERLKKFTRAYSMAPCFIRRGSKQLLAPVERSFSSSCG
jgi:hypothetical protein